MFVDFYKCTVNIVLGFIHMINGLNFTNDTITAKLSASSINVQSTLNIVLGFTHMINGLNFTNDTITAKLSASSINHESEKTAWVFEILKNVIILIKVFHFLL